MIKKPTLFRRISHYILPLADIALVTILLLLLRSHLSTTTVALIYLLPVLINTTLWGLGPGVLTAVLAFLAYNYLFLLPYYTFHVRESQDIVALVIFSFVAILISQLVGQSKRNLQATMAREQELAHLYELSLTLTGVNDVRDIADVIASKAKGIFRADAVAVEIDPSFDECGYRASLPVSAFLQEEAPDLIMPLKTARGSLGMIKFWQSGAGSDEAQERMMRTFASQAALAVERANLAESETRAKVLEESDRLKTALLSSVSHELRTPLATIKAAITSLMDGQVHWNTHAREDLLVVVDEETDLLNYLVGNLLDMSRIETGALKPVRQWNILSEIMDGVVERMHRTLKEHQVEIDLPEDLPLVPVDYVQMEQVFSNLLNNSAKFAPKGSKICITAAVQSGEDLLVEITNKGPNIPSGDLEKIFEKFYQPAYKDNGSGTGLGLSICKGIIEAHGGEIWAENLQNGTAFKFTLPFLLDGMQPPVIPTENL